MNRKLFCAFDKSFYEYGIYLIKSFRLHNPIYEVFCWGVNLTNKQLKRIKNLGGISIKNQSKNFASSKHRRCFMSGLRFAQLLNFLNNSDECEYIALDADAIVLSPLDCVYEALGENDILFHFNDVEKVKNKLQASFLAFKNTKQVRCFFELYIKKFYDMDKRWRWYNDQRSLYFAFEEFKDDIKWDHMPKQLRRDCFFQANGKRKQSDKYKRLKEEIKRSYEK